jgi:hypothetical protein
MAVELFVKPEISETQKKHVQGKLPSKTTIAADASVFDNADILCYKLFDLKRRKPSHSKSELPFGR